MTSSPSPLPNSDPQSYRDRLFALVGSRDPLDVMAQTPSSLTGILRAHSPATLRSRPLVDQWTPNEIIGHLADGEWVYGYRLRLVLSEPDPVVLGTNQDLWVASLRCNDRPPAQVVDAFATLRRMNVALLESISPADFHRTGRHNERGPESVAVMLKLWAGHDLAHLGQIARYLRAIESGEASTAGGS